MMSIQVGKISAVLSNRDDGGPVAVTAFLPGLRMLTLWRGWWLPWPTRRLRADLLTLTEVEPCPDCAGPSVRAGDCASCHGRGLIPAGREAVP